MVRILTFESEVPGSNPTFSNFFFDLKSEAKNFLSPTISVYSQSYRKPIKYGITGRISWK